MRESQESILDWSRKTFGDCSPLELAKRMKLEVDELVLKLKPTGLTNFNLPKQLEALGREVADVEIMLREIAELLAIDIQTVVDEKMAINRERRWAPTTTPTGLTYMHHVSKFMWGKMELFIDKWYLLNSQFGFGVSTFIGDHFESAGAALEWATNHEITVPINQPTFRPIEKTWDGNEVGRLNLVYGRDVYDNLSIQQSAKTEPDGIEEGLTAVHVSEVDHDEEFKSISYMLEQAEKYQLTVEVIRQFHGYAAGGNNIASAVESALYDWDI